MKYISIKKLFKNNDELLNTLHIILNIPHKESRENILKDFCSHPQMKPLLNKHDLLPLYFYYFLLTAITNID